MSEPKFTPGPWKVTDKDQFVRTTDGRDRIVAEAIFIPHVVPKEEREANAHLIAAAPDLYAALRELRNAWCLNACDAASPDEGLNHLPECYTARDALEKAVAP